VDGRTVYINGEKGNDVTIHLILKVGIDTASIDYTMAEMREYQDLAVAFDEKTGESINPHYYTLKDELRSF
jgi:aromatic ring hydroxylase